MLMGECYVSQGFPFAIIIKIMVKCLVEFKKKGDMKKTGRNDPCPCGSGKKFKKCCENKMIGGKFMATQVKPEQSSLTSLFQRNLSGVPKPEVKSFEVTKEDKTFSKSEPKKNETKDKE
jgi:hypothetical protein